MKGLVQFICDSLNESQSTFNNVLQESFRDKKTTGNGSIDMIQFMVDQLREHPDMKGKDKELWKSAGQFLYDFMKELSSDERKEIMDHFGLQKLSDWDDVSPADVSLGMHIYLTNNVQS